MKRSRILTVLLIILAMPMAAQAPQGINYQAVARDQSGSPLPERNLTIKITLSQSGEIVWSELHDVSTNKLGLFTLVIGDPDASGSGSAGSFDQIDWPSGDISVRTDVNAGDGFVSMGEAALQSVPYALYAGNTVGWQKQQDSITTFSFVGIGTDNPNRSSLTVQGLNNESEVPLFEVKRNDGVPVFAVYNDGVMVFVDENAQGKGVKGGFAVGGYSTNQKGPTQEYLRVTRDSVRIYVPEAPLNKGVKGGFAVGGYTTNNKGPGQDLLFVTSDSVRVYVPNKENDPGYNGLQGGFAVNSYDKELGLDSPYEYLMGINRGITRFNTTDANKGFAIGSQQEGWGSNYLELTPQNSFVGFESGLNTRTDPDSWDANQGSKNVFMGYQAGHANRYGHHNVYLGYKAGFSHVGDSLDEFNGSYNIFLGPNAGSNLNYGSSNIFLGSNAGGLSGSSTGNIFMGESAGSQTDDGSDNIFIGNFTGEYATGSSNVILGTYSGSSAYPGSQNVFIGSGAGYYNSGSGNVFIGNNAGYNEDGANRLYIENSNSSSPLIFGDFSTDLLQFNASVAINTIPTTDYPFQVTDSRSSNDQPAILGTDVITPNFGVGVEGYGGYTGVQGSALVSGTGTRYGLRGYAGGGSSANYGVYGYAYGTNAYAFYADGNVLYSGSFIATSDAKYKRDIVPVESMLSSLMKLKPKHYSLNTDLQGSAKGEKGTPQYGFIAQEMEEIFPDLVVEVPVVPNPGEKEGSKATGETFKGVKYLELIPILLKGMQEQQKEIELLKLEIADLKAGK